jgi:hypothetical protein
MRTQGMGFSEAILFEKKKECFLFLHHICTMFVTTILILFNLLYLSEMQNSNSLHGTSLASVS